MPERARRIHDEHVAIFEAIRRREPEQAVREMEGHIAAARDFVLERQELAARPRSRRGPCANPPRRAAPIPRQPTEEDAA